jgi:hypothetical protein
MKSRIEQDNEQYLPLALILPRRAAYAPLPQATKAGAKGRSHPARRPPCCARIARNGLVRPLPIVMTRGDEPGPSLSGPRRKGGSYAGSIIFDGRSAPLIIGTSSRQIAA